MPDRTCRAPDHCKLPAAENGYFCRNHWKLLDLSTRNILLAYPVKPGPPPDGRNQALHRALRELRITLNVQEPITEVEVEPDVPE